MDTTGPLTDLAPRTFFGVPSLRDLGMLDAQVAFLGVPYDGGTPEPGIPTGQFPTRGWLAPGTARALRAGRTWRPTATIWSA